jgi:hypothetical protein
MIQYYDSSEKAKNALLSTLKDLKIAHLLRKAGIRKTQGAPVFEVFRFLILLVFQGKNLYRFLDSNRKDDALSKNTYYRFLNDSTYAWRLFLSLLAIQVIDSLRSLTKPDRVNVLVLDDTIIGKNRSKKVELLARVHDHTSNRYQKGFTMLALGWSDGYSFIPVDFAMLSSAKKSNRIQDINKDIDKRCSGYKRRRESMEKKPDVAFKMVQDVLNKGISADYILMDTWFTHEPLIMKIKEEGLDVIGMVKDLKQKYTYGDSVYSLKELRKILPKNTPSNILGSVLVTTKNGLPVKLVYVKNRNNKKEWLTILCTDLSLSDQEVVRIYGNRWQIEVFFKSAKSFMKLGGEFQGRSYDMIISHTTIVFTRYILLEWLKREENDVKTFGELFFYFCDDIRDMDLKIALQSLMGLFVDHLKTTIPEIKVAIESQLQQWVSQQATYIKVLFEDLSWES